MGEQGVSQVAILVGDPTQEEGLSVRPSVNYIMWHFIWVFTVCHSTRLGVSGSQRVQNYLLFIGSLHNIEARFRLQE